jgi:hypothetical protein
MPHLREGLPEKETAEYAEDAVAKAIGFYRGFVKEGGEQPLAPKKGIASEFARLGRMADELLTYLENLSPEANERLTRWAEWRADSEQDSEASDVSIESLTAPGPLQQVAGLLAIIAARAREAEERLRDERRPRGRRWDEAAALLTEHCGGVWQKLTNLSTTPQNRDSDGNPLDGGPWVRFIHVVFEIAECPATADYQARQFHERRPPVRN